MSQPTIVIPISQLGSPHYGAGAGAAGNDKRMSRVRAQAILSNAAYADGLRVVYTNYEGSSVGNAYSTGEAQCSPFWIKFSLQKLGAGGYTDFTGQKVQGYFGGVRWRKMPYQSVIVSDPISFPLAANEYFFINTLYSAGLPNPPAFTAGANLAVTNSNGSLAAATWTIYATLVYAQLPDGSPNETYLSAGAAATTSGGASYVTITAPTVPSLSGAAATANQGIAVGAALSSQLNSGPVGYNIYVATSGSNPPFLVNTLGPISMSQNLLFGLIPAVTAGSPIAPGWSFPLCWQTDTATGPTGYFALTQYGEGFTTNDNTDSSGTGGGALQAGVYAPIAVLGNVTKGIAAALNGDSIMSGSGDPQNISQVGGYGVRACQASNIPFVMFARAGETLAMNMPAGRLSRQKIANSCTFMIDNMGINDIGNQQPSVMQTQICGMALSCLQAGLFYLRCTLTPRTTSTDYWTTIGNQARLANATEACRKLINDWIRSTVSVGATVTDTFSGTGAQLGFVDTQAFQVGTEVVTVTGATKTYGVDYFYTLRFGNVASGITFVVAPPNASNNVVNTFTALPGLVPYFGANNVGVWDVASLVEVDNNNVLSLDGGFWLAAGAVAITSTITSSGAGQVSVAGQQTMTFTDSAGTMTPHQYAGAVLIVTDGTHGVTIGTKFDIIDNTATTFLLLGTASFPTSTGMGYVVVTGSYTGDGLHPLGTSTAVIASSFASVLPLIPIATPASGIGAAGGSQLVNTTIGV